MDQTETVEQVYEFIKTYIREHTYPPNLTEIAKQCHMSRTNVTRYMDRLEGMGRIARNPNVARGITLLDENDSDS